MEAMGATAAAAVVEGGADVAELAAAGGAGGGPAGFDFDAWGSTAAAATAMTADALAAAAWVTNTQPIVHSGSWMCVWVMM